jgi:hypothetical protein
MQIIISLNGPNNILPVETELRDYLLASKNNSILEKILYPLLSTFERKIPLNIIMGEKDWRYRDWVLNKTENLFDNVNIFYAKNCITQIQSIEAFINNTTLNETDDFLVIPKDTIISKSFFDKIKKDKHSIELGLGTFRSNNPKYGYILKDSGRIIFSADRVISDLAFNGVYLFKNISLLKKIISYGPQERLLFDIFAHLGEEVKITLLEALPQTVTTLDDLTEYTAQLNGL